MIWKYNFFILSKKNHNFLEHDLHRVPKTSLMVLPHALSQKNLFMCSFSLW